MRPVLEDWVERLARELGVDPRDVDVTAILDLARDAAHTVARPAAPVSTFVAGYAAGLAGGGSAAVADVVHRAVALIAAEGARLDAASEVGSGPLDGPDGQDPRLSELGAEAADRAAGAEGADGD